MSFFDDMYINCNLNPTDVTETVWLFEHNPEIIKKYPDPNGKWMQFYPLSRLDMMWDYAKGKYRAGRLEGIHSMKVSTACPNPRASNSSDGVIIFFCGPSDDETKIMQYGQKLLEEIPYKPSSGWMSYKSDEQTFAGTAATGQTRNYLYRIRCSNNRHQ